jgi:hypothetical protein
LLASHERRLVTHPSYNECLDLLTKGTIDIENALTILLGDNDERSS